MIKLISTALLLGVLGAGTAFAADSTSGAAPTDTTTSAALPGPTDFTEMQARNRVEQAGYRQIGDLSRDDQKTWHGTAMKDGRTVSFALDMNGNLAVN